MFLTPKEIALEIKVSVKTVKRILATGQLPYLRVSRNCIRIEERNFRKWVRECHASTIRKRDTSSKLVLKIGSLLRKQAPSSGIVAKLDSQLRT